MSRTFGRREFFKAGAGLALALGRPLGAFAAGGKGAPVVGVGSGDDFGKAATRAVELLGGMKAFLPRGARVALLPNVQSRHPGSFTKPEILRAVIRLCREAGASEVNCLSWQTVKQWEDTGLKAVIEAEGAGLKIFAKDETLFRAVPVPGGLALKEARILAALYDHDALVNMPVAKDHAGNKFTGSMKNLMGLNSPVSNRTFHRPNWLTDPEDVAHLDQCIVDLNKAVRPALNIVDATEFIVTNGPFGPGEILKPHKVVAGADRVAVDAYCAALWGLKPEDIVQIKRAADQGLGRIAPGKRGLREARV
ncbi:MAG TPA: DUF362 domain-containing protein [Candidatus Aminicenantes bacterium]|nr:DUF362 domain-containing protein [Candidatus Aminicenantes bacterium]HRY65282.1 DUF362 domain-containing protein [Candidatus Aminicenantes bacterium]HRZ72250.1 DUF362 domain-containing protein [Candidatus Aminicenantes bacterium]